MGAGGGGGARLLGGGTYKKSSPAAGPWEGGGAQVLNKERGPPLRSPIVNQYFSLFLLSLLQCKCLLHELSLVALRTAPPVRMTASKRRVY